MGVADGIDEASLCDNVEVHLVPTMLLLMRRVRRRRGARPQEVTREQPPWRRDRDRKSRSGPLARRSRRRQRALGRSLASGSTHGLRARRRPSASSPSRTPDMADVSSGSVGPRSVGAMIHSTGTPTSSTRDFCSDHQRRPPDRVGRCAGESGAVCLGAPERDHFRTCYSQVVIAREI